MLFLQQVHQPCLPPPQFPKRNNGSPPPCQSTRGRGYIGDNLRSARWRCWQTRQLVPQLQDPRRRKPTTPRHLYTTTSTIWSSRRRWLRTRTRITRARTIWVWAQGLWVGSVPSAWRTTDWMWGFRKVSQIITILHVTCDNSFSWRPS